MIKAVIFDMDGVIVDTEPVYYERLHEFFKHNNIHPEIEELDNIVGSSSVDTWDAIQRIWGKELDKNQYEEEYNEFHENKPVDFKEIVDQDITVVLEWLTKEKYKIGLASSSSYDDIQEVLEQCNIKHYFHSVLSGEMFEQSKPNPEIYLKTAEALEVQPDECLVIEDSTYGIMAGKAAGMYVLAKEDNRFNFNQGLADGKIQRLKQVITELKN
ncbi:MAG: HAD family phosphatase [Carnobacterium sp.]|uniref:HAD family hydrolase n=1 Tax=Carnobacterium antarcticum TaxID=2126436 RepID=A0ABW4NMZ0_9LACT|nr:MULTISPECIES: HAD family phosphatase [unclassified Carnobacterium]ALV22645.1 Hydrolase, haloacid dehalogenase-like [Carnobacterium sp. CP1]QQP70548.1 HAD family phosphatase [Carnobacterium sp. CS13]